MNNNTIKLPWISKYRCHTVLYASKLAICTGYNIFESRDDLIAQFRAKKENNENYKTQRQINEELATNFLKETKLDTFLNNSVKESNNVENIELIKSIREEDGEGTSGTDIKHEINDKLKRITDDYRRNIIKNEIIKTISVNNGINNESLIRNDLNKNADVEKVYSPSKKFCVSQIPICVINGNKVYIGGKHDGINNNGDLIEIKNRVNGFKRDIPAYELVQLHAYMFIFRLNKCKLVENYRDNIRTRDVHFDDEFWDNVRTKIIEFMEEII